jgi:hypothetical protein
VDVVLPFIQPISIWLIRASSYESPVQLDQDTGHIPKMQIARVANINIVQESKYSRPDRINIPEIRCLVQI